MRFAKIYLEITNQCNLSCEFCPGTKRAPAFMTGEHAKILMDKLRGYTQYLYYHLMGEPLLHPELAKLLELAGQAGYRVILTTNGTLLRQKQEVLLRAPSLHKVNLSLHSFEANERLEFGKYADDCLTFAKQAAAKGILVNLRLWNLDAEEVRGIHACNDAWMELLHEAFGGAWERSRGGIRLADRIYLSQSERFVWPSLTEQDHGEQRYCYGLKDQLGVLCNGTVVPCCLDHEGDLALGNLFEENLEQILQKPRTMAMIEGFQKRKAVEPLCRRCGYSLRFGRE